MASSIYRVPSKTNALDAYAQVIPRTASRTQWTDYRCSIPGNLISNVVTPDKPEHDSKNNQLKLYLIAPDSPPLQFLFFPQTARAHQRFLIISPFSGSTWTQFLSFKIQEIVVIESPVCVFSLPGLTPLRFFLPTSWVSYLQLTADRQYSL